jgi:hypothetical protein
MRTPEEVAYRYIRKRMVFQCMTPDSAELWASHLVKTLRGRMLCLAIAVRAFFRSIRIEIRVKK